jgi:transcriptional regulator GlxA family with amidase domain
MLSKNQDDNLLRIGFLLMPGFPMMSFCSAVEPLRMANQLSKQEFYRWPILTPDGKPQVSSNGVMMQPDCSVDECPALDILIVCSELDVEAAYSSRLERILLNAVRQEIPVGSISSGAYLLARAGLLDGYRCTLHWENLAKMRHAFPQLTISDELFVIDRDRYTCAGGSASFDMMLQLMNSLDRRTPVFEIAEHFLWERIRDQRDQQQIPLSLRLGTDHSRVLEAVSLMDNNIEEPIGLEELTRYVGLSLRQMERLFRTYLGCAPSRYYMGLRLKRARRLFLQTNKSIVDVAQACGFSSTPHFSKRYREYFGKSPGTERCS